MKFNRVSRLLRQARPNTGRQADLSGSSLGKIGFYPVAGAWKLR